MALPSELLQTLCARLPLTKFIWHCSSEDFWIKQARFRFGEGAGQLLSSTALSLQEPKLSAKSFCRKLATWHGETELSMYTRAKKRWLPFRWVLIAALRSGDSVRIQKALSIYWELVELKKEKACNVAVYACLCFAPQFLAKLLKITHFNFGNLIGKIEKGTVLLTRKQAELLQEHAYQHNDLQDANFFGGLLGRNETAIAFDPESDADEHRQMHLSFQHGRKFRIDQMPAPKSLELREALGLVKLPHYILSDQIRGLDLELCPRATLLPDLVAVRKFVIENLPATKSRREYLLQLRLLEDPKQDFSPEEAGLLVIRINALVICQRYRMIEVGTLPRWFDVTHRGCQEYCIPELRDFLYWCIPQLKRNNPKTMVPAEIIEYAIAEYGLLSLREILEPVLPDFLSLEKTTSQK